MSPTTTTGIVDRDLRPAIDLASISEWLPEAWREYYTIESGTRNVESTAIVGAEWGGLLPGTIWDTEIRTPAPCRTPAEAIALMDPGGVASAIVNPGIAPRLTALSNPRFSASIASATNDWLATRWLGHDERLRGSIVLSARSPKRAADEVRRVAADDDRFDQVVIGYPHYFLGDRALNPIYEAATEYALDVVLQAGGAYAGSSPALTGVGHPMHALEWCISGTYAGQPHLASLVAQGTFERFPSLRIIMAGFGAAWLPSVLWRLDTVYESGAVPIPKTMSDRPSETLRAHVQLTTDALETHDAAALGALLAAADAERMLVFGSGLAGIAGANETIASLPS